MANIVAVNGCFDLFHPGHVHLLKTAQDLARRERCDLWVLINSDHSVRQLKGGDRPYLDFFIRRACVMAAVNFSWENGRQKQVLQIHSEDHLQKTLKWLRPRFLVKGDDWKDKPITGAAHCDEIVWVPRLPWSATDRGASGKG